MMRTAEELANVKDPAWPWLQSQLASAPYPVRALPIERDRGKQVLARLQVTARSVLGALALESGGILVDHAWLRILGGGSVDLPDLAVVNEIADSAADVPRRV